jgi:hypothetical protein
VKALSQFELFSLGHASGLLAKPFFHLRHKGFFYLAFMTAQSLQLQVKGLSDIKAVVYIL